MKKSFIVLLVVLASSKALCQTSNEICGCDSLLRDEVIKLYQILNSDTAYLEPFIDKFISKRGFMGNALKVATKNKLDSSKIKLEKHSKHTGDLSCFQCSTNKELKDYVNSLLLLSKELNELDSLEISSFQYNQILASYHYLVAARSSLMASADNVLRHCSTLAEIKESEKRIKRHTTKWSSICVGLIGLLATVVIIEGN